MDIAAGGLCCPACASRATFPGTRDQIAWMSQTRRRGLVPQKNTGAGMLFGHAAPVCGSRLETPIKAGRLLP